MAESAPTDADNIMENVSGNEQAIGNSPDADRASSVSPTGSPQQSIEDISQAIGGHAHTELFQTPLDGDLQVLQPFDTGPINYEAVPQSCAMPGLQAAEGQFNPLSVKFVGSTRVERDGSDLPIFRDNVVASSSCGQLLFVGCREFLLCFEFDSVHHIPLSKPSLRLSSRPPMTTVDHMDNAVWPVQPHNINLVKVGHLRGSEVIVSLADDGRTSLWLMNDFLQYLGLNMASSRVPNSTIAVEPTIRSADPACTSSLPSPIITLQNENSAWGADFNDDLCLLAVSDNSRRATVYDLSLVFDNKSAQSLASTAIDPDDKIARGLTFADIPYIKSPFMGHNVPDVAFVTEGFDDLSVFGPREMTKYCFLLAAVSISGHVTLWSLGFPRAMPQEPSLSQLSHCHYTADLGEDGWTVTYLDSRDFAEMPTLSDAVGSPVEDSIVYKSLQQANRLAIGTERYDSLNELWQTDQSLPNNLIANLPMSRGIVLEVPCMPCDPRASRETKLCNVSGPFLSKIGSAPSKETFDVYSQRACDTAVTNRLVSRLCEGKEALSANKFLLCTTKKGAVLVRAEDCVCNAYNKNIFGWRSRFLSDEVHFDRLNIVAKIPELCALVVVSQLGLISIMRLTSCNGVFAMRQEYVFPQVQTMLYGYTDQDRQLRPLAGLTVHSISGTARRRFRLCAIYVDGLTLTYELSREELEPVSMAYL